MKKPKNRGIFPMPRKCLMEGDIVTIDDFNFKGEIMSIKEHTHFKICDVKILEDNIFNLNVGRILELAETRLKRII